MKSLFSCFSKKGSKSKRTKSPLKDENLVVNIKPIEVNNCNYEETILKTVNYTVEKVQPEIADNSDTVIDSSRLEDKPIENKSIEDKERHDQLIARLNNALARIENVYSLLNNKYSISSLSHVVNEFDKLCLNELDAFSAESDFLGVVLQQLAHSVRKLFFIQKDILLKIDQRHFANLQVIISDYRAIVKEINAVCIETTDLMSDLYRLIADSLMMFGWLCVTERVALFVQNNLEGFLITITRLLNDGRFVNYYNWLKLWRTVLRRFSTIITDNFKASLMWGIDGPVPMDILYCLFECNYSRFVDQTVRISSTAKEKVVKTTAAQDVSCKDMENLMGDLRSGQQKARLKPVSIEYGVRVERENQIIDNQKQTKIPNGKIEIEEPPKKFSFSKEKNLWIVEDLTDESDIELVNRNSANSVLIRNCHNCTLQIDGTVRSILLEKSSSIKLVVDEIADSYEIRDCSIVESQIFADIKTANLRSVSQFKIFIPLKSVDHFIINSFKSSEIDLFHCKSSDGGLELEDYDKVSLGTNCRSRFSNGTLSVECF